MAALDWYGNKFFQRTGIVVKVRGKEVTPRLDLQIENSLFRIAQEALNNVLKHSKPSKVEINLEANAKTVLLIIADNGIGFDASSHLSGGTGGWGLITMRERALAAGGSLRVESELRKGTRLIVEVSR